MVFTGYRVTSNYGWRIHPIEKVRKFHGGIDLVKSHKALIQSFTSGKVIYSGDGKSGTGVGGYGNVVVIKDENGCAHVYCHLDSVIVKKGKVVSKGDNIGRQGATGRVTGSHLHYEIRKTSSPMLGYTSKQENSTFNPSVYLKNNSKGGDRMLDKLEIDGIRGKQTIRRWQQFFGNVVDGHISRPSATIKSWQRFLNRYAGVTLKIDGYEGIETIKASQKFFGLEQDGVISNVSIYIKELQKFLNNYGR